MNDTNARELRISINRLSRLMEMRLQQQEDGLRRWRDENLELSKRCKRAATVFSKVHNVLLEEILEVTENSEEDLNTFTMHEFLDKYGPKLPHLQNMIQILTQLGS